MLVFNILVFLHSATPTLKNSHFSSKLNETSLDFISKTSFKVFLTFSSFKFIDFVLDFLKPRVGFICVFGLGKLNFSKIFPFCQLGLVPFCLLLIVLAPCGILTCIQASFSHVHALFIICVQCVHTRCLIKCLYVIFLLFWTPMSTKFWGLPFLFMFNMF